MTTDEALDQAHIDVDAFPRSLQLHLHHHRRRRRRRQQQPLLQQVV